MHGRLGVPDANCLWCSAERSALLSGVIIKHHRQGPDHKQKGGPAAFIKLCRNRLLLDKYRPFI